MAADFGRDSSLDFCPYLSYDSHVKRYRIISFLVLTLPLIAVFFVYGARAQDDTVAWRWRYGNPNIYFNYDMPWRGKEIIIDDISGLFDGAHRLEFWLRWSSKLENPDLSIRFTDGAGGISKVVSVKDFLTPKRVGYFWHYYYYFYVKVYKVEISMLEFIQEGFNPTTVREIILDIPREAGQGRAWVDDILIKRL